MKASIDGVVAAEPPDTDPIDIEGNHYFPPASLTTDAFSDSSTPYDCPWNGDTQSHDVSVDGSTHRDAAWSYPDPYPASFERVGRDDSGYVAFDERPHQRRLSEWSASGRLGELKLNL